MKHSSPGAEILACTEADDRGFYIKTALKSINTNVNFTHEVVVDSKGIYDTLTTLHEGRGYRLRQTVQRVRDSFESGKLNIIRWIQGNVNISDALTKINPKMHHLFNRVCTGRTLDLPPHNGFQLDTEDWN